MSATADTSAPAILTQITACHWAAHINLDSVTNEQSLFMPEKGGNSINWLFGHIVATRCQFAPAIGAQPVWNSEQVDVYRRGSDATKTERFLPFEQLLRDYDAMQERLVAALHRVSPETLEGKAPFSPGNNPDETVGSLLAKITFHESYHLGQTAIVRRVQGLEGQIR